MKTTETVLDLDPEKVFISKLNTRQPKAADVKELAASIAASGQISPAIVRPLAGKPGCYELAAGARRKMACTVAKVTLKAICRAIPDSEFEDMILTDNLQREDPDPMQEAILIERRIAAGVAPSEIAARYGKSDMWLKRRMKLTGLIKKCRKAWVEGGAMGHFTTEMMEFIGSLSKEDQLHYCNSYNSSGYNSLKELTESISRQSKDLKGVTWLHDKATFVKGCGPGCATDTKGSLFLDDKHPCGSCVNTQCFRAREKLHCADQLVKLLDGKKESDFVFILTKGYSCDDRKGVLNEYTWPQHYTKAKKAGPDTVAAIDMANPSKPVLVHLLRKQKAKASTNGSNGSNGHSKADTPGLKESREDRHTAKRLTEINEQLQEHVCKAALPTHVPILNIVAAFGLASKNGECAHESLHAKVWESLDAKGKVKDTFDYCSTAKGEDNARTREEVLWEHVKPLLRGRLAYRVNGDLLPAWKQKEMQRIAQLTSFDYAAAWDTICRTTFPPPKSWGQGIDPVTLKFTPKTVAEKVKEAAKPAKPATALGTAMKKLAAKRQKVAA